MNLPNKLTFIRLVLAVPFIYFLQESNAEGFVYRMIAFALFVVASLTDFFDGYLARKYNLVTDFGKLMDPLADKILVIFLISGIRMLAAAKGEVIPAGKLGKYKTTSQMIVILIMIVVGNQWYNFYLMLIPIILTLWSGWEYTSKAKHYFMNSK